MSVNSLMDLTYSSKSVEILQSLFDVSKGKGEGSIKCTVTKHRIGKTAILLGIEILTKRSPSRVLALIERCAPIRRSGWEKGKGKTKVVLCLECSSPQGILTGIDQVWRLIDGEVSRRRVTKAALCLGLESLNRVEPSKVRQLVSKVCPVPRKYWDPELGQWL
jgi:hypothetical protein